MKSHKWDSATWEERLITCIFNFRGKKRTLDPAWRSINDARDLAMAERKLKSKYQVDDTEHVDDGNFNLRVALECYHADLLARRVAYCHAAAIDLVEMVSWRLDRQNEEQAMLTVLDHGAERQRCYNSGAQVAIIDEENNQFEISEVAANRSPAPIAQRAGVHCQYLQLVIVDRWPMPKELSTRKLRVRYLRLWMRERRRQKQLQENKQPAKTKTTRVAKDPAKVL